MAWWSDAQNWRRGTNQMGNRYDHRGDGAAEGGSYHYSNQDGSYYYQNRDGSTYYSSSEGYAVYTAPYENPRCYESNEYDEDDDDDEYNYEIQPQKRKKSILKTLKRKVSQVKKAKANTPKKKNQQRKSRK